MKKIVALFLVAIMALSMTNAFALNYQQCIVGPSTFETLEEAKVNGIAFLNEYANPNTKFGNDPALDTYPVGTTYIYRSATWYSCNSAGARMNTNILVYTDAAFASKDEAYAYIESMGLIDIIEEAYGSIVLVTPANGKAFAAADQYAFYQLQEAMCNIGGSNRAAGVTYAENKYFGGLTYRYLIAIDGGATFFNEYIASTLDYVSRLAGVLVVNGKMAAIRNVAGRVPAYLVNPAPATVEKYKAANEVNASGYIYEKDLYYNAERPLQKVLVLNDPDFDLKAVVEDAYYNMFVKAMRNAVVMAGLNTASTLYSSYAFNQTPYSLSPRNAVFNGKTADGLYVIEYRDSEKFAEYVTANGEFVDVWYEVLPEEVLNNTAPAGTIPLLLANHGGGDDPIQFLDEIGWLNVAGDERIAIIAPRHQEAYARGIDFEPALVKYMLETYPALDASHVYVTGYSYGGNETYKAIKNGASLFAAMVPMGSTSDASEDWTPVEQDIELPYMIITATQDFAAYNTTEDRINDNCVGCINKMAAFNYMDTVDVDFEAYPIIGFRADLSFVSVLNGEYTNHQWYLCNEKGWPMVGCNVTEFMPHGLYQEFARMGWEYMKHWSRDPETKEISYDPYVK